LPRDTHTNSSGGQPAQRIGIAPVCVDPAAQINRGGTNQSLPLDVSVAAPKMLVLLQDLQREFGPYLFADLPHKPASRPRRLPHASAVMRRRKNSFELGPAETSAPFPPQTWAYTQELLAAVPETPHRHPPTA